jgi:hypothetical protein
VNCKYWWFVSGRNHLRLLRRRPAAATSHDRSLAARLYLIESEVLAATNHLTKAMAEGAIELPSHVSPE